MKIVETFTHEDITGFKFGKSPFGRPKFVSHVYYIDGLLIDTGHHNMKPDVFNAVQTLPVTQIFITHHHEDHTGNLADLQSHFNCPAYSSALCSHIMKNPPSISFAQNISWGNRPAFHDLIAKEGQIETEKYTFTIIPIPGHAADMVALHEPQKGWLFSADLYVNSYIAYFLAEESTADQITSIKHVLKLDFDVLLCGHNPKFSGGKEKLKKKLNFLETFYGQIATLYQKGYNERQIFKELKLKENWSIRLLSSGALSKLNMVKSVIRDEKKRTGNH